MSHEPHEPPADYLESSLEKYVGMFHEPLADYLEDSLAFFDLETTGLNPAKDRIVEMAVEVVGADGWRAPHRWLINPGVPISPGATAVHGYTDASVEGCPSFREVAEEIWAVLDGCDLAGFNIRRFDLPLLCAEFKRIAMRDKAHDLESQNIVDVQHIYHRHETRTLSDAVQLYLGQTLDGAHSAIVDTSATVRVFRAQIKRYGLPPVAKLSAESDEYEARSWFLPLAHDPQDVVAPTKGAASREGDYIFQKGKYKGELLSTVGRRNRGYLRWMLMGADNIPESVKKIVRPFYSG